MLNNGAYTIVSTRIQSSQFFFIYILVSFRLILKTVGYFLTHSIRHSAPSIRNLQYLMCYFHLKHLHFVIERDLIE